MTVAVATSHTPAVEETGGRYPFRPACSCGWSASWGYVAAHAAQLVADEHAKSDGKDFPETY